MYLPEIREIVDTPPEAVVDFVNPRSTHYRTPLGVLPDVEGAFAINRANEPITDLADPKHIREHVTPSGLTVVSSAGGDTVVNKAIAAQIGNVPDDPKASAANAAAHKLLLPHMLYVAIAKGHANNYALSALGPYALHPELLATAPDLYVGKHHPLEYRILDADERLLRSGIVTSCIGLKTTAQIMQQIEERRKELSKLSEPRRLSREARITLERMWNAEPFSAELECEGIEPEIDFLSGPFTGTTLELIGSWRYGKVGLTGVNVDDTFQQVVRDDYEPNRLRRAAGIATTLGRVMLGRHELPPVDFTGKTLRIKITSKQPVPFHIDGNVDDEPVLERNQVLELTQSKLALSVLMRERRKRRGRSPVATR